MAATDHMRAAAGELIRAADVVKMEIDKLRSDKEAQTSERKMVISQRLDSIRRLEHDKGLAGDDSSMQSRIAQLRREISDYERDLEKLQHDIEETIREKIAMIEDLQSQARTIAP
jgi:hypothetical protein